MSSHVTFDLQHNSVRESLSGRIRRASLMTVGANNSAQLAHNHYH